MTSFRDSGEFKESTGFGAAGQGGGDTRQRRSTRQDAVDLANDMDTSKYSGNLRDAIQRKNIDIKNNQRRVAERIAEDPTRAGFRGFLPSRTDIDAFKGSFGRGLDALKSTLTPGRMIASGIGSALFGPVGGILAGLLANQRTVDAAKKDFRDTINFGKQIGQDLKTDFFDTIDFFTPQQAEQPMITNIPMRRPDQMFPIRSVTETTGMPFMDQIPDMFPDNQGQPTYTPEAAGFGLDSLMQDTQDVTIPGNITDDMMFRAAVTGDPYVDTNFGALTFGPTVFGAEGFKSLEEKGLVPVGVSQNITPAFLRRDR